MFVEYARPINDLFLTFLRFYVVDLLRNDLFVTLLKADVDKSSKSTSKTVEMRLKSAPKNIELRIIVLDNEGLELHVKFKFYLVLELKMLLYVKIFVNLA